MIRIFGMLSAGLLVVACSSISKKQGVDGFPLPPSISATGTGDRVTRDHDLENKLRDDPSVAMKLLVRYRQARLWAEIDPPKSCALWLEVANTPRFPLAQLARIRALENCPAGRSEVESFSDSLVTQASPWLQEAALRASLHQAELKGDPARDLQIDYLLQLAPYQHTQAEQVKTIGRAVKLSKEIKDDKREEKAQAALEHVAPRFIIEPKAAQYMSVANDFRRARDFEKARDYYKREFDRADSNDFDKLHALDGARMSFKLEGARDKYLQATRDYSDFAKARFFANQKGRKKPALNYMHKYVETRITLARAVWTENSPEEAEKMLLQLERELKHSHQVQESVFLRARIEEERGHLETAVKTLQQINVADVTDHAFRLKLLWYRGWNLRKVGRLPDAVTTFTQLLSEDDSASSIARDHFWLARTFKQMGDNTRAETELKWLTANDPLGYYGMLAYHELAQPIPPLMAPLPPPLLADNEMGPPAERAPAAVAVLAAPAPSLAPGAPNASLALFPEERLTFEWLVATSETDFAKRFLDQIDTARHSTFSADQTLDELQLYARAGAYQSLFARLNDLSPDARMHIVQEHPELIFPRPWGDLYASASSKYGVEKELALSITRQESSFNPMARSAADAFGLMQLIPEMAAKASVTTGIAIHSPEDLYQPEINIPLGTEFLKSELDKWEGQFIPAVASYNAGYKAVHGWMRNRDRKDPLQFIEDIPYDETRGYVKLVLRNFIFYSRLNSVSSPLAFPDRCLNGLQDVKL